MTLASSVCELNAAELNAVNGRCAGEILCRCSDAKMQATASLYFLHAGITSPIFLLQIHIRVLTET